LRNPVAIFAELLGVRDTALLTLANELSEWCVTHPNLRAQRQRAFQFGDGNVGDLG